MPHHRPLDPPNDQAPGTPAAGSAFSRVSSAVLGNLLRIVRALGSALEGFAPNL